MQIPVGITGAPERMLLIDPFAFFLVSLSKKIFFKKKTLPERNHKLLSNVLQVCEEIPTQCRLRWETIGRRACCS